MDRLRKIGRLNNNGIVILDYAHTPDALNLHYHVGRIFKLRKINLVFGWRERQAQKKNNRQNC